MPLLKCAGDRSSQLADAPLLQGVQIQSPTALFRKITLRKAECIPKLLVSEYVLQLSNLCLCHQISTYMQVQTNWDLFAFEEGGEKKGGEMRQTRERSATERPIHAPPTPPLLFLDCSTKKQWLFWGTVKTRQLWKKLIAMINDNGLEESWDTAATYIILSHQSLLLPAPLPPTARHYKNVLSAFHFFSEITVLLKKEGGKRKRERQRGSRVNKKMACKITIRYSKGKCTSCNHSRFQQLDSSHAEATFSRSYLPYGSLFGWFIRCRKYTDKFYCISLNRQPMVSITKLRPL